MSYFLHIYYCHIGRQTKYFSLCILYLSKRIFPGEFILLLPTVFFLPSHFCLHFLLLLARMWSLYLSLYYFHHFHFFSLSHSYTPFVHGYFITIHLFNGVLFFHSFFLHFIFCYIIFILILLLFIYIFYVLIFKADFSYPTWIFSFLYSPLRRILLDLLNLFA